MCGICAIQVTEACPVAEAAAFSGASTAASGGASAPALAVLDPDQLGERIDALLSADDFGIAAWHTSAEPVLTFTYQFETAARADYPFGSISAFSAYSAAEKAAVRTALDSFEAVLNIRFTEVSGQTDPDFSFYNASDLSSGTAGIGGWRYGGGNWDGAAIFRTSIDLAQPDEQSLILHEIGHALGLKHPGAYGGSAAPYLPAGEDSEKFTVMSYNDNPDTGLRPRNLMLYDIAALQQFWGANLTTRTGNDTWTGPDDGRFEVVWDAGGTDTIAHTGAGDAVIDLNEGAFSRLGSTADNFAVAYGVAIENASGNGGNDRLTGNALANTLTALGGNDTLAGGDGNDTLIGGAGADIHDGGAGEDWARFAASAAAVAVSLAAGTGTGGDAAGDTFTAVEHLFGSANGDSLAGDGAANSLAGFDGNDTLDGAGGDDWLQGGEGADSLAGGTGTDTADYAGSNGAVNVGLYRTGAGFHAAGDTLSGIERLTGSGFSDTLVGGGTTALTLEGGAGNDVLYDYGASAHLYGGDQFDVIVAGAGADSLFGGDGTDSLFGGAGPDRIDGGAGIDTASYTDAVAAIDISLARGTGLGGDAEGDVFILIENLIAGAGNDRVEGDGGANQLFGGPGADTLIGGAGNDQLYGNAGADVFVFGPGWGRDLILGWEDGLDRIDLRPAGLTLANFTQVDSPQGLRLDWFDGTTTLAIHLFGTNAGGQNLAPGDLDAGDFLV